MGSSVCKQGAATILAQGVREGEGGVSQTRCWLAYLVLRLCVVGTLLGSPSLRCLVLGSHAAPYVLRYVGCRVDESLAVGHACREGGLLATRE